jgi:hypothetical protein
VKDVPEKSEGKNGLTLHYMPVRAVENECIRHSLTEKNVPVIVIPVQSSKKLF